MGMFMCMQVILNLNAYARCLYSSLRYTDLKDT